MSGRKVLAQVALFTLIVVMFYTTFANQIPQVEQLPPQERVISADLAPEELAAIGEEIVADPNGQCMQCHAIGRPGLRAPDLNGVGARAAERVPGKTAEDYLHTSLLDPTAYVVEGFQPIMPSFAGTLKPAEQAAVIAFLQSLGGEITVKVPAADAAGPAAAVTQSAKPTSGEEVLIAYQCFACHTLQGVPQMAGQIGPDLTNVGSVAAERVADPAYSGAAADATGYLTESVLKPGAFLVPTCPPAGKPCDNLMPPNFEQRIPPDELELLVSYLAARTGPPGAQP